MKKRIVSILLAAITLLCALPFTVPAYAAVTEDYKLQPDALIQMKEHHGTQEKKQ